MNARLVQCLLLALALQMARAEPLQPGSTYALSVTDLDQRQLSTADGHVTVVCAITRANEQNARVVGDRIPRLYYGDPKFRMITIVDLSGTLAPLRPLVVAWIRHRLDLEGERLQAIYRGKGLDRNARQDIHVIADLTGEATAHFGVPPQAKKSNVFVFAPNGLLVAKWDRPPSADDFAAALERAGDALR
jgi:hypothetical protein